ASEVDSIVAFDNEDFAAIFGGYEPWACRAELRIDVTLPQVGWFEDVTIGVDDVVIHMRLPRSGDPIMRSPPSLGAAEAAPAGSLQVVVTLGSAGQNLGERFRWQAHPTDHTGRVPKAVEMRVVCCPQNVARADVIGQERERLFDRFKRDKT